MPAKRISLAAAVAAVVMIQSALVASAHTADAPLANVIREVQPAAGQLKVELGGVERAIGDKAAAGLYVRPASG